MAEINLNTIPGIVKAVQDLQKRVAELERTRAEPAPVPTLHLPLAPFPEQLDTMLTTDNPMPPRRGPGRPRKEGADYG